MDGPKQKVMFFLFFVRATEVESREETGFVGERLTSSSSREEEFSASSSRR